jgi:LysM repeat protein
LVAARQFLWPAAFLAAVTLIVIGVRMRVHHSASPPTPRASHTVPAKTKAKAYYVVRAGDTLGAIAEKKHVPLARLRALNPKVTPTALFLGQRIRLR